MKTCIIFGGNGFVGSHLADGLVQRGYDVKIFGSFQHGTENLSKCIDNVELIKGDYLNRQDIHAALNDVDVLFHFISATNPVTSIQDPALDIETNVIGSIRLFQAALENDVEKIVYSSSGGTIYGQTDGKPVHEEDPKNPINPYAISKLTIEHYLEYYRNSNGIKYTVLRYSNPFGERQNPLGTQGVIPVFLNKILHDERPVIFGDGTAVRDYIYIRDAIDATLAVFESKTDESVFNIGSGYGISINQLVNIMSEVTGKDVNPVYIENTKTNISTVTLDISRISKATGWAPQVSIKEGIIKTWNWLKQR